MMQIIAASKIFELKLVGILNPPSIGRFFKKLNSARSLPATPKSG
jgi:hypothetical protein